MCYCCNEKYLDPLKCQTMGDDDQVDSYLKNNKLHLVELQDKRIEMLVTYKQLEPQLPAQKTAINSKIF